MDIIVGVELTSQDSSTPNHNQFNKQQWLYAWERAAIESRGGNEKVLVKPNDNGNSAPEAPCLHKGDAGPRIGLKNTCSPAAVFPNHELGTMEELSKLRVQHPTHRSPSPAELKLRAAPTGTEVTERPQLGRLVNRGTVPATRLASYVARFLPDVNVRVIDHGGMVDVAIRDFKSDEKRIAEVVRKLKDLLNQNGVELGRLVVNGVERSVSANGMLVTD